MFAVFPRNFLHVFEGLTGCLLCLVGLFNRLSFSKGFIIARFFLPPFLQGLQYAITVAGRGIQLGMQGCNHLALFFQCSGCSPASVSTGAPSGPR